MNVQKLGEKLAEKLAARSITDELREQILPYAENDTLTIVSPDIAVVVTSRSVWGSTGGVGYYDHVRVFYGAQSDIQEWQWRDRFSASNDKHWLRVLGIGNVKVSYAEGKVTIEVELINEGYGNRTATFTFDAAKPPQPNVQRLSPEEQERFVTLVEQEISRIKKDLEELWEYKPKMLNPYPTGVFDTYIPYQHPRVRQKEVRAGIGVAAFVTEEQIDHRGSDPQMRYTLYILKAGMEKAEAKAEDHGYSREGGAYLTIVKLDAEEVVIETKNGKETIVLR